MFRERCRKNENLLQINTKKITKHQLKIIINKIRELGIQTNKFGYKQITYFLSSNSAISNIASYISRLFRKKIILGRFFSSFR